MPAPSSLYQKCVGQFGNGSDSPKVLSLRISGQREPPIFNWRLLCVCCCCWLERPATSHGEHETLATSEQFPLSPSLLSGLLLLPASLHQNSTQSQYINYYFCTPHSLPAVWRCQPKRQKRGREREYRSPAVRYCRIA